MNNDLQNLITNLMTPEELQKHITECQTILENKKKEKWEQLVTNLIGAAKELHKEFPFTTIQTELWCEGCEGRIDVDIDIEDLTRRESYFK